jgi:hypothetical protein
MGNSGICFWFILLDCTVLLFTSWVVAVFGDIFDGREYQKERGLLLVYILYEYLSGKRAGCRREYSERAFGDYGGL